MGKSRGILHTKLRSVNRKIRDYLYKNKIYYDNHGVKQNKLFSMFLEELDESVPPGMSIRDFTLELYESRKYSFLQAIIDRPDIPPKVWKELKQRVFDTYGKVCLCCGSEEHIAVDHIKPYSRFPELCIEFDNLQPLCRSCNSSKGNRDIVDYRGILNS